MAVDPSEVTLAAGSHRSPGQGVCALELASMLADEEFSDRPRCVCPTVASVVRAWNDRAKHRDRQRLRPYCERMVGTRGDRQLTEARREHLLRWIEARGAGGPAGRRTQRLRTWWRIAVHCGLRAVLRRNEGTGEYAARVSFAARDQDALFALLDDLLAVDPSLALPSLDDRAAHRIASLAQRTLSREERRDPHRDPLAGEPTERRPIAAAECDRVPDAPCGDDRLARL